MSWTSQQQEENKIISPSEAGEAPCEPVGEEVQRLSVLESLPDLLRDDNKLCMQRVVPKVRQALPNASAEFHMAASSTFLTILEKNLVHPKTFTQTFLHSIVSSLESKDPVVANAWLETLLDVMDLLPTEVVRSEILPIAISKGQLNQSVSSRLTACKLLGKVCMRFESYVLKKEALPLVHSLCQDVNREVRASMCYQLKHVAKGLGPEVCKIALLPSLVELANDEEASVRLAAVPTIVDVLPLLQPDTLKGTIVPLVKKLCSQALNAEDEVITATSYQLGKLCLGLDSHLTKAEKKWFMNHYQDLAKLGLASMKDCPSVAQRQDIEIPFWDYKQVCSSSHPLVDCPLFVTHTRDELYIICRQHCAYNFPAMAMFSTKHGDIFHEQLYTTFCDLTSDPYVMVRRTIACCIHEVTSVLGSASSMVKNEVVKLLRDEDDEVLQGLIPNIAATLELLAKSGNIKPENMDTTAVEMGRALMKCEAKIGSTHNWRLHSLLISQLECLPSCLPGDFIHSQFVPMMFARIHTARPIPCRTAAAHALLIFLRFTRKPSQKAEILARISTELGHAKSCYGRMMFIKLCRLAMEVFSTIYFKEYFFLNMLDLYVDRVPNIRLALVKEIPRLKMMLCLPMDHKLFVALETCIRKLLITEKDRDVLGLLNCVIQELDKIEVSMEGSTIARAPTEEELEDMRKLEEENKLALSKFEAVQRKSMRKKTIPPSTGFVSVVKAPPTLPGGIKRVAAGGINLDQTQKLQTEPRQSTSKTRDTKGAFSSSFKRTFTSLEDEFYVDAGIRIPQQLASSDLPPFQSRIPNLREILFRNRSTSDCAIAKPTPQGQKISVTISVENKRASDTPPPSSASSTSESKLRYSSPLKQSNSSNVSSDHTTNNNAKSSDSNTGHKTLASQSVTRRHSGMYNSSKLEHISVSSTKVKTSHSEQKQRDATVIANRRHSYMDGEKGTKGLGTSCRGNEILTLRKGSYSVGNRRHSYIEKVSADDNEKSSQGSSGKRSLGVISSNKRHSYIERDHSSVVPNVRNNDDSTLRKSSVTSRNFSGFVGRNVDNLNKRRSLIFPQSQSTSKNSRRVSSLDRGCETEMTRENSGNERNISNIPQHPQSLAVENKRRHSSLERDDLERLKSPGIGHAYSNKSHIQTGGLRSSLERISTPNEEISSGKQFISIDMNAMNVDRKKVGRLSLFKNDLSINSQKDMSEFSASDENLEMAMLRKGNRLSLSKIPRGGASCHSSPGGSRASSPTGTPVHGNATRVRQRTAPNSRASSPTGSSNSRKGHQRLSLGSLNSYMSNLKLADSASRLPVRKPP